MRADAVSISVVICGALVLVHAGRGKVGVEWIYRYDPLLAVRHRRRHMLRHIVLRVLAVRLCGGLEDSIAAPTSWSKLITFSYRLRESFLAFVIAEGEWIRQVLLLAYQFLLVLIHFVLHHLQLNLLVVLVLLHEIVLS